MEVLKVESLHRHFGGLRALNGVSLAVEAGERRAIIGPNGAGKTTLFNVIAGELAPTSGRILLHGRDVTGLKPNQLCSMGISRTFQKNNLFLGLSVFENVRLAVQVRRGIGRNLWSPIERFSGCTAETSEMLRRMGLWERRDVVARNLSYGEQRQLEVAIALASRPSVLLLDEPTAGMSPAETLQMTEVIRSLPRELTILIIEHDMDVVFALADRITVLQNGEVLASGTPDRVKADPQVQSVYLGLGDGDGPAGGAATAIPGSSVHRGQDDEDPTE